MFGIDDMVLGMGGAALIGGLFGKSSQDSANEANINMSREQRVFSAEQAQKQMDFQERMSNTSYQRGVKDMQAAGLNPMLAYSQGGASTTSGAMGSYQPARVENVAGATMGSAASAAQIVSAAQQIESSRAQVEQVKALTAKTQSETMERNLNTAKLAAEIEQVKSSSKSLDATADNTQQAILGTIMDSASKHAVFEQMKSQGGFAADVAKRKAESTLSQLEIPKMKAESQFYEGIGQANPYLRMLLEILKGARR